MRTLLFIVVASLAGACVVEPVDDEEYLEVDVDWSAVEAVSENDDAWPDALREMSCRDHYDACMRTKLGGKRDDYGRSRCQDCMDLCRQQHGCWPSRTRAGRDCEYWKEKYRRSPKEREP